MNPGTVLAETRVREIRRAARELLASCNVHLRDGHFELTGGRHSSEYFNPHAIFEMPTVVWQLVHLLLDLMSSDLRQQIEVVSGPYSGGAHLAFCLAGLLDGDRKLTEKSVKCAPLHKTNGWYELKSHYQKLVRGKRVLLVDDVRRLGQTLSFCAEQIESAGGELVATAVFLQKDGVAIVDPLVRKNHAPHFFLDEFSATEHDSGQCPLCEQGITITQF